MVPLDYALETSLVRIKLATSPGTFADDPDVGDPAVALPVPLVSAGVTTMAWYMPGRTSTVVKIKVTFRDDAGDEIAGTFTAYAFGVVPLAQAEKDLGATRPTIEKLGSVGGTSATPMVLDELGIYDQFGLRFSAIVAPLATRMFVRAEEVG